MAIPDMTDLGDLTAVNTSTVVKTVLDAKYTDAAAWATWAARLLESDIANLSGMIQSGSITEFDNLLLDLGDYLTPPEITPFVGTTVFIDTLISTLRTKLIDNLNNGSTGLGDAVEAAMFAREQGRITAERAVAYNELTTQFTTFPSPPGAMLAKITEISNETSKRLTDSSSEILKLTATLAQDTNKATVVASIQFIQVLADVHNSSELRALEAYKTTVMADLEAFKAAISAVATRAELLIKKADLGVDAKTKQLTISVEIIKGLAQSAAQMVASALNSVNVSSSLGYSAGVSSTESTSETVQHIFEGA